MARTSRTGTAALLLALAVGTVAGPAYATENVSSRRLAGDDRYATAAAIAQAAFTSGSRGVILTSGVTFPDALASAYAAGRAEVPLLLTDPATLPASTEQQLAALNARAVTIVGGSSAVSESVVARLRSLGYEVSRIAGTDRYDTAREVAQTFPAEFVASLGGLKTAIVASGEAFPDALAGAPLSYSESFPVLLTPSGSLSPAAARALDELGVEQVLLLGGTAAVGSGVEQALEARGITVQRLAGVSRAATAVAVADFAIDQIGWPSARVNLARGDVFADALAGGPKEGQERSVLLLTSSPTELGSASRDFLSARDETVASIDVLGGESAVATSTVQAAVDAATTG